MRYLGLSPVPGEAVPRKSPYTIKLTREEREILEQRSRRYTLPYRDVIRAKIILLAAEGLEEEPRRGRPAGFSPSGRL